MTLRPLHELPPSPEVLAEQEAELARVAPEDRVRPRFDMTRGRGALLALALLGLALFFAPWVELTRPESVAFSGFDLARSRAGWLWGGAVAWFILLPLVWTRRTIHQLRGVRVIAVTFAAMTLAEVSMLLLRPPAAPRFVPVELTFTWGLYASGLTSLLAAAVGARLGGSLPDPPSAQEVPPPTESAESKIIH